MVEIELGPGFPGPPPLLEIGTLRTLDAWFTELAAAVPHGAPVDPAVIVGLHRRHDAIPLPPGYAPRRAGT